MPRSALDFWLNQTATPEQAASEADAQRTRSRFPGLGPGGSSALNPYLAPLMGGAGAMFPNTGSFQFNAQSPLDLSQINYGTNPWWGFVGQPRMSYYDPVGQPSPWSLLGDYRQAPTTYPYGPDWDAWFGQGAYASGPGAY